MTNASACSFSFVGTSPWRAVKVRRIARVVVLVAPLFVAVVKTLQLPCPCLPNGGLRLRWKEGDVAFGPKDRTAQFPPDAQEQSEPRSDGRAPLLCRAAPPASRRGWPPVSSHGRG